MVQYMIDGSYFDQSTKNLAMQLVLYNAPANQFANVLMDFKQENGGGIRFSYQVQPMDLQVRCNTTQAMVSCQKCIVARTEDLVDYPIEIEVA